MESHEFNSLLEYFNKLTDLIESKTKEAIKSQPQQSFTSSSTNLLADAMSVAQGQYLEPKFTKLNPYTKTEYHDMAEILRCTRKALSDNKIFFTQVITQNENAALIITTRLENQGQYIQSTSRVLPIVGDPKATDSAIEIAKRSAAKALLGISSKEDYADDDGIAAYNAARTRSEKHTAISEVYAPEKEYQTLSKDQIAELDYELQEYPDLLKDIYSTLRVESLADIPGSMYREVISKVRSIKALRAGHEIKRN
jgi:hypothetical protein